jgi:hypothetical protein
MAFEFGVKTVPSVLFLALGTYRFCQIHHIGVTHYRYSQQFIAKLLISSSMAIFLLSYIAIVFSLTDSTVHSSWINKCS